MVGRQIKSWKRSNVAEVQGDRGTRQTQQSVNLLGGVGAQAGSTAEAAAKRGKVGGRRPSRGLVFFLDAEPCQRLWCGIVDSLDKQALGAYHVVSSVLSLVLLGWKDLFLFPEELLV